MSQWGRMAVSNEQLSDYSYEQTSTKKQVLVIYTTLMKRHFSRTSSEQTLHHALVTFLHFGSCILRVECAPESLWALAAAIDRHCLGGNSESRTLSQNTSHQMTRKVGEHFSRHDSICDCRSPINAASSCSPGAS